MGTHQARPLPATPPFPASATVAPSASYLSIPPSEPLPRLRSSATPLEAPSGSSGLVPVRGGPRAAAPLGAPGGSVPTIVPMTAPPRVQWDTRRARIRPSATTFGLAGRIVITAIVVLLVAVLSYGNPFGIPIFLAAAAWLLRDLWAKARVAPPVPPSRPSPPRPGRGAHSRDA